MSWDDALVQTLRQKMGKTPCLGGLGVADEVLTVWVGVTPDGALCKWFDTWH